MLFRAFRKINRTINLNSWMNFAQLTFSQNGEDVMLSNMFSRLRKGFFIDVGAHHPFRFSNTYLLYRQGWSGINIDALPGTKKLFEHYRPRDITIEMGVSDVPGSLTYWSFEEPAYNTFEQSLGEERSTTGVSRLVKKTSIQALPLRDILSDCVRGNQPIDFLTIDVEGFDLKVLRSNDWTRYRPRIVLCEVLGVQFHEITLDEVYVFMQSVGYSLQSKLNMTAVFATD